MMNNEDKKISLELARELHKLGVKVESEWCYFPNGDITKASHFTNINGRMMDNYRAYDSSELGEMLPIKTHTWKRGGLKNLIVWHCENIKDTPIRYSGKLGITEAEARGKMLKWLIKNDYVKAGEL